MGAAVIPLAMMTLGGIDKAGAAKKDAKAQQEAARYQAAVNDNKAIMGEYQARDAIARGQTERTRHQLKTAQLKGSQRARFAAAGLDLTEGSAFNVLMDTDFLGKTDELMIADNAEREAWVYRESAKTDSSNAGFLRSRAASISPSNAGFSSLLGSAGTVSAAWYGMKQQGAFT